MNKRGQESIPVLQGYALVKVIIAIVLVLIVIGIVAVSCSFIETFNLDSGTKRTFDSIVQKINLMSNEDYKGEKEEIPIAFIKADLAIVGFSLNKKSILVEEDVVNRPFECGEISRQSCLAICVFDDVGENSCTGERLLGKAIFNDIELDSKSFKEGILIEGKIQGTINIEKEEDTFFVDIVKS